MAAVVVVADGGVAPRDKLSVNFSRNGNVLTNGQAENIIEMREFETVAGTIN